jgi:hypothetical protein
MRKPDERPQLPAMNFLGAGPRYTKVAVTLHWLIADDE